MRSHDTIDVYPPFLSKGMNKITPGYLNYFSRGSMQYIRCIAGGKDGVHYNGFLSKRVL